MTTALRLSLLLCTAFALVGTTHAVPFDLTPPSFDQPQIKVSGPLPSYDIVCDSRVSLECDLPPGRYQVQEFDFRWTPTVREVTLTEGRGTELAIPVLYRRSVTCSSARLCQARCDVGQDALGGSCTARLGFTTLPLQRITHRPRLSTSAEGAGGYYLCETNQPAFIEAGVTCASRRVPAD